MKHIECGKQKDQKLRIHRRSSLLVYLVSNLLLLIIPAVILMINTRVTYNFQTQMLARSREQLAGQFQQSMDNKLDEMDKVYRAMFTDEEVVKFMFVKDTTMQNNDYYTVLQIVNKLGLIYDRQSSISGLYLYFPASGSIITPTYRLHAKTFYDRILNVDDLSFDQWTRFLQSGYITLSNVHLGNEDADYLYFVRTMYITTDVQYSPVIFFSISKDDIRRTTEDLLGSAEMSVEIVDARDNSVIYDMETEEDSPYITLPSSIESLSYRIHYPANSFSDEYALSLRVILFSAILGFAINIGFAVFLAYRNYKPIRNTLVRIGSQNQETLGDENEFVQMQAIMDRAFARNEEMKPVYMEYYLRQLLEGHIRMTQPVLENVAASGVNLSEGWFQIIEIIPTEEGDKSAVLKTIRTLMDEDLIFTGKTYYITHENAGLTVLRHFSDMPDREKILTEAETVQRKAEDLLSQPIAVYVSRVLKRTEELPGLYQQAEKARVYVGWSGYSGILTYEEFMNEQAGSFRYSIDDELQLINYIRSGETEKVSGEIDQLFRKNATLIKEDDPQASSAVRSMMIHLLSTYLKVSQQLGLEEESFSYDAVLTSSPQQARKWCTQAFCDLSDRAREKYDKNSKAVRQVQEYIAAHYADDSLNLAGLADVAGLSAPYLSTLFKQNTGMNLSEHINRVRIDHAKEKLAESDSTTVHDIAVECGFYSDATFTRVFKKIEGITPGEYRKASNSPKS